MLSPQALSPLAPRTTRERSSLQGIRPACHSIHRVSASCHPLSRLLPPRSSAPHLPQSPPAALPGSPIFASHSLRRTRPDNTPSLLSSRLPLPPPPTLNRTSPE